jgi:hypothetical protein
MKAGIKWCAALCDYVLEYFSTVYNSHWSRDWVMCCSFLIFRVRVFFNSPTNHLWKQGLSDVLLFCDYTCLKYFQQSYPIPTYEAGVEWCAALLWLHVLKYFQQSYPIPTYKAGIEWCAALLWFHVLKYFQQSHQFHLWSRDWVMCCFLCDYIRV